MKIVEKYTNEIIQDLFLRACKSRNGVKNVEKLYQRFYYKDIDYKSLSRILITIYQERISTPIDIVNLLDAVRPYKIDIYQNVQNPTDTDFYKQIVIVFVGKIALSEIHTIKDYKIPAYWRNYERYENNISTKSN